MASKIKRDDQVTVITGSNRGKSGKVIRVDVKSNRAWVSGVNVVKYHAKPTRESKGGILSKEASIHMSNLALIDPESNKPTKVGFKKLKTGEKVRFAKKSGKTLPNEEGK